MKDGSFSTKLPGRMHRIKGPRGYLRTTHSSELSVQIAHVFQKHSTFLRSSLCSLTSGGSDGGDDCEHCIISLTNILTAFSIDSRYVLFIVLYMFHAYDIS